MKTDIVNVFYEDKRNPGNFGGRAYSYRTAIPLGRGDYAAAPARDGESRVYVAEVNVPESRVDERILPLLKTITRKWSEPGTVPAQQTEPTAPPGDNANRMLGADDI
jgi:hypothetical protein